MHCTHLRTSSWLKFSIVCSRPGPVGAIITGAGDRAFSAGNDLKYQASGGQMGGPASGFAGLTARFDNVKPVIAAVNGLAMGEALKLHWHAISLLRQRTPFCTARAKGWSRGVSGWHSSITPRDRDEASDGHAPHRTPSQCIRRPATGVCE